MSSAIRSYFAGRSVFISGGSGFLGKHMVEKLLRSCSDIERIYLLIRPLKNQTAQQRIEEITKLPVFARLNREHPNASRKIVAINGDIGLPGLGISDTDHQTIASNVTVVIHSAAVLRFKEPLRNAIHANVYGTRQVLELAKSLTKPEAFVYVSTAYSNPDRTFIEEKVYDPPIEHDQMNLLLKLLNDEQMDMITPTFRGRFPNSYGFSKAITEKMVKDEIGSIPCAIVRPSVIVASAREPFEGWVDNNFAVNGFFNGIGSGMMRSLPTGYQDIRMDLVPVDFTTNAIIAAIWKLSVDRRPNDTEKSKVVVYNVVTSDVNPITVKEMCSLMTEYANMYPLLKRFRKAVFIPTAENKNRLRIKFDDFVELPIRCFLADLWSRFLGQKPRWTKTRRIYYDVRYLVAYFTSNDFDWSTQNLKDLEKNMSPFDRQEFSLDRNFNWKTYFRTYWLGLKEFYFKESPNVSDINKPDAKKK